MLLAREIEGYSFPIYRNYGYPWGRNDTTENPPVAPVNFNPIGKYRKTFQIPEDWDGRQVLVHFEAVDSAFYLFVNGLQVGYSQGSRTPAEFDITQYLLPGGGEQVIAAEVYRWNVGSWIEDQDIWRLSGIFRYARALYAQ
jgi:beta-galactosidase